MKVFIFGCGFSGLEIGSRLAKKGQAVWGTTRSDDKIDQLRARNIHPLIFDGSNLDGKVSSELANTTHLIISIAPPRQEASDGGPVIVDPVLKAFGDHRLIELLPKLQWVGYLSTVGVYGNHDGAWIDESTHPQPLSARSRQRVRAENEWRNAARIASITLCVFRLSGIYGPGRNALRSASEGRSRRLVKKGQVFNRIHVQDIARAVDLALTRGVSGDFNITDDEPAPPQDVVAFAHSLLNLTPPPELDFETAALTPMARSFYGENKRVSNLLSKDQLGMDYQFANYRIALQKMFDGNNW